MKLLPAIKLPLAIGVSLAAGAIGGLATSQAIPTWYATLNKPWFNPPNWLFGPVWTILYLLMGISLYLLWQSGGDQKGKFGETRTQAIKLFFLQLFLNTLWSLLFFGIKQPILAFIEIVLLWGSIALLIKKLIYIRRNAAYLLIPYLAWVSFAAILNLSIVILN